MLSPLFLTIKHRRSLYYRHRAAQFEIKATVEQVVNRNRNLLVKKKRFDNLDNMRAPRVKNICIWSGRCRGIVFNGFSRHAVKFFGTRGRWLGLRKASW